MAFSDEFVDTGKWNFVAKEERQVLIKEKVLFTPERIIEVASNDPKFSDQYVIFTRLPGDEDEVRAMGFGKGSVDSRDRLLSALTGYLERIEEGTETDPAPQLYIEQVGQAQILRVVEVGASVDA